MKNTPHFVLFSGTRGPTAQAGQQGGTWHFRLQTNTGVKCLAVADFEAGVSRERLELLAAVRGLEALEQPSTVTLVTGSRQLPRAIRQGLDYWRNRDWKWERFGEQVPMKNADLWQRIDRAMQIHEVRCRRFRVDPAQGPAGPKARLSAAGAGVPGGTRLAPAPRPLAALAQWTATRLRRAADSVQRLIPETSASPHPSM